jgi:threonyl-tRNA synthetase
MRILALQCDDFSYTLDRPSKFATDLSAGKGLVHRHWMNCLLLLLTVEPDDFVKSREAAKSVRRVARNAGATTIVINAFAHLSENLATPEESEKTVEAIRLRLDAEPTLTVFVTPFGWYKNFGMQVASGGWSQRYLHV